MLVPLPCLFLTTNTETRNLLSRTDQFSVFKVQRLTELNRQQTSGRKQDIDHPERSFSKPGESTFTVITSLRNIDIKVTALMLSAHATLKSLRRLMI